MPGESSQAAPLPLKRGELGFDEGQERPMEVDLSSGVADVMNSGPHPAEQAQTATNAPPRTPRAVAGPSSGSSDSHATPSVTSSVAAKRAVFQTLRSSLPNKRLGGLSNATVVRMAAIVACVGGVIALWIFSLKALNVTNREKQSSDSSSPSGSDSSESDASATPVLAFVHIAFAMAIVILLVFFERVVYQARVERYAFLHPGLLPQYRLRGRFGFRDGRHPEVGGTPARIPFAPWNRPPLPTYAAAVGVRGTGDVEDDEIAAPPPPAYGNIRGSTLLMMGVPALREGGSHHPNPESGNRERRSSWGESLRSFLSRTPSRRGGQESARSITSSPIPHSEQDAPLVTEDMTRAIALEMALSKLEEGAPVSTSASAPTAGSSSAPQS